MIVMSDDFKNSVSATEREMKGYVEVSFVSSADKSEFTIDNEPEILQIGSVDIPDTGLLDDDRKGKNYASLEQDYFLLDGTFVLPNNDANKNPGMGYVSKYTFEQQQEEISEVNPFHFTTNATGCSGITVYFQNNKPLDLEIRVASNLGNETFTDIDITDTGIASVTFSERDVTDLYIIVNDMLYTNRRLRIQEIDFGLSAIYEGEDLISFKTIEEIDIFAESMPSNSVEVRLGDYTGKFDPNNDNGITSYLNDNVLIKPFVGVVTEDNGIEYCIKGTYWLESYDVNGKEATLKGTDIYSKLQEKDFDRYYIIEENRKIETSALIEDFLDFKSDKWGVTFIDEHSDDYEITSSGFPNKAYINEQWATVSSKTETLQKMCLQGGGTFNADRYGNIKYQSLYGITNYTKYLEIPIDILKDYAKKEKITPIKTFTINETTIDFNSLPSSYDVIYSNSFNSSDIIELYIDFEKSMTALYPDITNANVLTSSWSVDPTMPEGEQGHYGTYYGTFAYMKLQCNGSVSITMRGAENPRTETSNIKQINKSGKDLTISNDFIASNGTHDLRHDSNAIMNFNLQHRYNTKISFEYNGNPCLECGDLILTDDKYKIQQGETLSDRAFVTKIESTFNGAYSERIEGDILE